MEEIGERGDKQIDYKKKRNNELTETKDKTKKGLRLNRNAQKMENRRRKMTKKH